MLGDVEREYCRRCDGPTNQEVIGYSHKLQVEPFEALNTHITHVMLRCRGCDAVIMIEEIEPVSDEFAPSRVYYSEGVSSEIYFKKLTKKTRPRPSWIYRNIPLTTNALITEIYTALENDAFRLAAMGIRAVLESVMKEKIGDRPFKVLVDEFQKDGYLSTRQALSLDSMIEAGHAAIHRGWEPSQEDIDTLLDITESLIQTVYLHEDRARELDQRVPRRGRPPKSGQ